MPCAPPGPARSVTAVVIHLCLAVFAVAFALSSVEALGLTLVIFGARRLGLAIVVSCLAVWLLRLPAFPAAIIEVPALTYAGAVVQALVDAAITRASVLETRRRVPRL